MAQDRPRVLPSPVLAEDWTDGWTRPTRDLTFFHPRRTPQEPRPVEPEPEPETNEGAA